MAGKFVVFSDLIRGGEGTMALISRREAVAEEGLWTLRSFFGCDGSGTKWRSFFAVGFVSL